MLLFCFHNEWVFSFLHSSFISFHFTLFCFFLFFIILSYYGNCCCFSFKFRILFLLFIHYFVLCFIYVFVFTFILYFEWVFLLQIYALLTQFTLSLSLIRKFCARSLFCARFSPNKNSTFCLQLCLVKACEKEMSVNWILHVPI